MATPVHQEKRKHQARSPKIESKDDQPIKMENLEKNSVKNLSVKQIKEICDKNLQVCLDKQFYLLYLFFYFMGPLHDVRDKANNAILRTHDWLFIKDDFLLRNSRS